MPDSYIERILKARVYDVAHETPLTRAPQLSSRLGNEVFLKREDLQPVFSFKLRGAYNKLIHLDPEVRAKGVIAASAGNHAQGVALGASRLGVQATIVMPRTTPAIKVRSVRAFGGKAVLHGDSYDEAYAHAMTLVEEKGLTFLHPFDDPDVIAGQGTIGMEILRQHPEPPHAIFVPVGGGGLISGIAAYVKWMYPQVKIIGVEPAEAPTLHDALAAGKRVELPQVGLFADGVAVRLIGEECFRVARKRVDEVVLVSTDEICAAIKDIFDDTRGIAEPAGALAVAGLKRWIETNGTQGAHLVAIESGANINFDRLRHVAERAELGEHREALLAVEIPERPGSFLAFCRTLGKRQITEFNYRYADARRAQVFVGVELSRGSEERAELIARFLEKDFKVVDMTDNETAKQHIRFMVGGHAPDIDQETLVRFEFPERPGALLNFLTALGKRWNISLFHYRNHGAAYGRVLMGAQIPPAEQNDFLRSLDDLGYPYWEETGNPAYRIFAGAGNGKDTKS
ncbi:threonine dehydratase, biosynthetic [Thiorhodococcus drewsii AZ1]|uniref:L-threonine dehydratase n=1 Tax=Thiorhodococcus drewsii AZ1 TaxID=765913 RepID=G2DXT6_9GAMM|nr:threonine ammonia-lyase, biosynthetic [Thiorhodococcus drewsii]EGV33135.1 threonine dehydratase, biosynthetic [Thiorhodococcus drewsii AZ1]